MKIRTAEDAERFRIGLAPIDEAFWQSERKWGVGRLERLVSTNTLAAYKRGWDAYREVLETADFEALDTVGPKMIAALAFMDTEATAAGHQPLAPDVWEAPMANGITLVVCRTNAEASAVIRASNAGDGQSWETTLPPDLAVTVRQQHEGRALVVVTLAEIVRLMQAQETGLWGTKWEGTEAPSGAQGQEGDAAEIVRSGYPLKEALALDF